MEGKISPKRHHTRRSSNEGSSETPPLKGLLFGPRYGERCKSANGERGKSVVDATRNLPTLQRHRLHRKGRQGTRLDSIRGTVLMLGAAVHLLLFNLSQKGLFWTGRRTGGARPSAAAAAASSCPAEGRRRRRRRRPLARRQPALRV